MDREGSAARGLYSLAYAIQQEEKRTQEEDTSEDNCLFLCEKSVNSSE